MMLRSGLALGVLLAGILALSPAARAEEAVATSESSSGNSVWNAIQKNGKASYLLWMQNMHTEALSEAQKAFDLSGDSGNLWVRGYVYARAGRHGEARQQINELLELSKRRYIPPYDIAQIYAGLGEKDQALAWLEKAFAERSRGLDILDVNPVFDQLRSDPRFVALTKRIGRA